MTSGHLRMGPAAHRQASRTPDAAPVNRRSPSRTTATVADDGGRSILEAIVALALIAIAVTSWGRLSVTSARTEATVAHREVALELASNTLEQLRLRPWDAVSVDPAGAGAVRTFDGNATVLDTAGVAARVEHQRDGRTFIVTTHITESGNDSWRHAIAIVEWDEGGRDVQVRLDSALRRPDTPAGP